MTQNGRVGIPILRHGSSHDMLETFDPTAWLMVNALELEESIKSEKLEFHWIAIQ